MWQKWNSGEILCIEVACAGSSVTAADGSQHLQVAFFRLAWSSLSCAWVVLVQVEFFTADRSPRFPGSKSPILGAMSRLWKLQLRASFGG